MLTFSKFLEDKKGNYLDGLNQELSVNQFEKGGYFETGPVEIGGLQFNQSVWKVFPLKKKAKFARIQLHKSDSPNLNQRVYKQIDGKQQQYEGPLDTEKIYLIPIKKFAELVGRPFQAALQSQSSMI